LTIILQYILLKLNFFRRINNMKYGIKSAGLIAAFVMIFGAGAFFANESKAEGKTYKIGDKGPAGGWIFYDKGNSDGGWRYLEAAPVDQSIKTRWGCFGDSISGARGTAIGTGKSNTQAIVKKCFDPEMASRLCTDYRGGGKSDWFLPSKDELDLMYKNLKKAGIGDLDGSGYWSSSEDESADYNASIQDFSSGFQCTLSKVYTVRVRAVRAF